MNLIAQNNSDPIFQLYKTIGGCCLFQPPPQCPFVLLSSLHHLRRSWHSDLFNCFCADSFSSLSMSLSSSLSWWTLDVWHLCAGQCIAMLKHFALSFYVIVFFFVVSFLFRSPALVQQVQICWCPQWLEEANLSACKIHLCRERLFHHRILDNQNIARLVNSRVNLGDFAKNHKALYCSYRTSNPSQSVGYHYARRVKTPQALSQGWIKSEEAQRVGQAPYCHH